jgi:hypothetical protein
MDECGLIQRGRAVIGDLDVARPLEAFDLLLAGEDPPAPLRWAWA